MPCDGAAYREARKREDQQRRFKAAVQRLKAALANGTARVVIDKNTGAIAFAGWNANMRDGVTDACAYRRLLAEGSFELKRAVLTAEAQAGRKINLAAVSSGVHSHDGGRTWGKD